jgi:N-acetylneuraminic acid mutarotase
MYGSRYNPQLDTWTNLPPQGAPRLPAYPAVWSGEEMIVWGGGKNSAEGGRFNPDTNGWTALPTTNMPQGRMQHSAVWTGSEMIIWGGSYNTGITWVYLDTGARFSPFINLYLKP